MEDSSFIFHSGERSRAELIPKKNPDGEHIRRVFDVEELLKQEDMRDENIHRLKNLHIDPENSKLHEQPIRCYQTASGAWVVELRPNTSDQQGNGRWNSIRQMSERVGRELKDVLDTCLIRSEDVKNIDWEAYASLIESQFGICIEGITEEREAGVFCAAMKTDPRNDEFHPEGYRMESASIASVHMTKMVPLRTRAPEAPELEKPGLNPKPSFHMAVAHMSEGKWSKSVIVPHVQFLLDGADTTALQYAQECFEGEVAVIDESDVNIFRLDDHAKRFNKSCRALGLPGFPEEQYRQTIKEVVLQQARKFAHLTRPLKLYIRPYAFGTKGGGGANTAKEAIFGLQVYPFADYFVDENASIAVEGRLDLHRPYSGPDKLGANYGIYFREKDETKHRVSSDGRNYSDMLFFDAQGLVEEFTSCCAFFVEKLEDGSHRLVTPFVGSESSPEEKSDYHSLNSITRRTVIGIAEYLGIEVLKADIHHSELAQFVGHFTVGSAAGITRVKTIDIKTSSHEKQPFSLTFDSLKSNALIYLLSQKLLEARLGKIKGEWVTKIPLHKKSE